MTVVRSLPKWTELEGDVGEICDSRTIVAFVISARTICRPRVVHYAGRCAFVIVEPTAGDTRGAGTASAVLSIRSQGDHTPNVWGYSWG